MDKKLVYMGTAICAALLVLCVVLFISNRNKRTYEDFTASDKEFQIDTEEVRVTRDLKDVVNDNKDYIESKGLTCDLVTNGSWVYNSVDDVYTANIYSDGFHAVIISITNNTIVIDPE